jgi:iron complex outermembrane recepter protein
LGETPVQNKQKRKEMQQIVFLAVLCAFLAGTPIVWADESEPEHEPEVTFMEEVVVTATRFERETEKVPAKVTIIDREEIDKSGARNVPEVLRNLGGVHVRDLYGNRVNQSVDMGGFGEGAQHRTAVLINGRRLNPIDLSNVRWSTISLDMVERIEVMHGGNAVLYGDNAMGGVINIITKRSEEGVQGSVEALGGSFDTFNIQASLNMGSDKVGMVVGVNHFQSDGYRDRSETESFGLFSRVEGYFTEKTTAYLEVDVNYADYQLPGSLRAQEKSGDRKQALNSADDARDSALALSLGVESYVSTYGLLDVQGAYQRQDSESNMQSWASFIDYNIQTWSLTPKYRYDRPLAGMDNRLTLGVDIYRTGYEADRGPDGVSFPEEFNHTKDSYSGYLQNELEILNNLVLNLGARYQDTEYTLRGDTPAFDKRESIGDPEWAWNAGLAYSFSPGSKIYARAYQGFRYPLVDEYMSYFTGGVNKDLVHETQQGYEAGTRLALANRFVGELRGFFFTVDDKIAYNMATGQNENLQETEHKGVDLDLSCQVHNLVRLYGSAGYTRARITAGEHDGKNIPLVPEWKGHAGIELGRLNGFLFRLQNNYVGKRYYGNDYENNQKKMSSYNTWDAYLSYEMNKLELFAHAKNILGEEYSDYGFYQSFSDQFSYYPQPEQEYMVGVRYRF